MLPWAESDESLSGLPIERETHRLFEEGGSSGSTSLFGKTSTPIELVV